MSTAIRHRRDADTKALQNTPEQRICPHRELNASCSINKVVNPRESRMAHQNISIQRIVQPKQEQRAVFARIDLTAMTAEQTVIELETERPCAVAKTVPSLQTVDEPFLSAVGSHCSADGCSGGRQGARAKPRQRAAIPLDQHVQQYVPDHRQQMHMLAPIDMRRGAKHLVLEGRELAQERFADAPLRQHAQMRSRNERLHRPQCRGSPERQSQIEMKAHIHLIGVKLSRRRSTTRPFRCLGHRTEGTDALHLHQMQRRRVDPLVQAEVIHADG